MKKLLAVFCSLVLAGMVQAEPPKVTFAPTGGMIVNHGKALVEFLPDGSVRVTSDLIALTIPGKGQAPKPNPDDPVKPPKPIDNETTQAVLSMFGADLDQGKADKAAKLAQFWRSAQGLIEGSATLGQLNAKMKALPVLPEADLRPIREYFRDSIRESIGTRADAPIDAAKTKALFASFVAALEACQ